MLICILYSLYNLDVLHASLAPPIEGGQRRKGCNLRQIENEGEIQLQEIKVTFGISCFIGCLLSLSGGVDSGVCCMQLQGINSIALQWWVGGVIEH